MKKAPQKLLVCVAVEVTDMVEKGIFLKYTVEYGLGVFGPLT